MTIEFKYNSLQRYFSEIWINEKRDYNDFIMIPLSQSIKSGCEGQLAHFAIISCLIYLYRINSYENFSVWLDNESNLSIEIQEKNRISDGMVLTTEFLPYDSIRDSLDSLISLVSSSLSAKKCTERYTEIALDTQNHDHINITFLVLNSVSDQDKNRALKPAEFNFKIALREKILIISATGKLIKFVKDNIKHHIISIFSEMSNRSKIKINEIDFMSDREKSLIMSSWNNTYFDLPAISVQGLFENACIHNPNKIAVKFNNESITYKELNDNSNQLARYFLSLNIKPDSFIGVLLERSIDMLIAILAVLKIGATYIPIDSRYPLKRIKFIIQNSGSKHIITDTALQSILEETNYQIEVLYIDKIKKRFNEYSERNLRKIKNNRKLAYLIYTSGSTGKPKGVLISHRNIINYAFWFSKKFELNNTSIIDFSSSIGFDLAVPCTLVPLIVGATISICSNDIKLYPSDYLKYLSDNYITHIECIPNYFSHLLSYPNQIKKLKYLKWILLGADALIKKDLKTWLALNKKQNLVNEYGPTECTVAITSYIINNRSIDKHPDIIPIGKPSHNTHAFVLDKYMNICPIGAIGELFIGGLSVSEGYLEKEKNTKKFIKMRLLNSQYKKYYNTGDLAKWLPSGDILFLGRVDDQVKISGFRIEITEIENQLLENQKVNKCKVIVKTNSRGEKFLIAYVVLDSPKEDFNCAFLKTYLKTYLPWYMIPAQIINIDNFPINASGKIDIKRLSLIEANSNIINYEKFDPDTKKLFKIWDKLLGHKNFSLNDNFLDVGGGSLSAASLMLEIDKQFLVKLPLGCFAVKPTINSLLKSITEFKTKPVVPRKTKLLFRPHAICLKESGSSSPLFLIPPVGGTVFIFKKFVEYLQCDRKVFALQDPALEAPDIKFNSIQSMAKHYVAIIKEIQPIGPYSIAGASFGATLSIEIAYQLQNKKNNIQFLGLLDGWAIYSNSLKDVQFFSDFMHKKMLKLNSQYAKSLIQIQFEREHLLFEYKIPPLSAKIDLFKADELWPIFESIDSPKNHWDKFISSEIHVHKVRGDHESMFYEPNVKGLVKIFLSAIPF